MAKMAGTIQHEVALMTILVCLTSSLAFPVGPWYSAYATYYGDDSGDDNTMGGACGYSSVSNEGYGVYTAALSDVLFQNGALCGSCYEIQCVNADYGRCNAGSVFVTATNNCPFGSYGGWCDAPKQHFDLSVPAFETIAQKVAGVVPIQYRRVPCMKQGGIRFLITGNPYFQLVLVYNVAGAGDVQSVYIQGNNNGWEQMQRNWSENWQFGGYYQGQSLSIVVNNSDGATVVSINVAPANWAYGQTFEGLQFS